nr:PilI type IV pilus biogenesis protein [Escherichia coli]
MITDVWKYRGKSSIPGSSCEWKDVTLAPKSRNRVQL